MLEGFESGIVYVGLTTIAFRRGGLMQGLHILARAERGGEAVASLCRHRVTLPGRASSATCAATEIALLAIDR
jgi:hypothetical protein